MDDKQYEDHWARRLADKAQLRRKLRDLPIEDKLKLVALMQRRNNSIRRATGRPVEPEWSWELVGLTPDSPPPEAESILAKLGVYELAMAEQQAVKNHGDIL
ncbi:MAG: hypothetical protein JRF33_03595 [Deltaproteobacteria bacterium]|nr:hypothetical protein [Deltaproteobacteria bacterium]